ncbi:MAG: COX15/CtaA family protein [Acidimicrobiales bacterium]
MSLSPGRYRQVTGVALALLAVIIVTGAAVRLTGSGLGCSDWPTCEEDQLIAEVDDVHAMVEFVNRVITGLVSIAVVAAVLGAMWRVPQRRDLTLWAWGLVAGVIAQILLGALVVREHLPPQLVMGHFLLSMVLIWNGMVLYHRAGMADVDPPERSLPRVLWHCRVLTPLSVVVLVTGTFVTGSGPHSGSETAETRDALEAQGVDVSGLELDELEVERLPFEVSDVAQVHGVTVMVFLAAVVWFAVRVRNGPTDIFRGAQSLVAVVVAQAAVGYVQYFAGVPALLVAVHVAGAIAVWMAVLSLHLRIKNPIDKERAVDQQAPGSLSSHSSDANV